MFKKYNIRDVDTEVGIQNRLSKYSVPDFVWDEYHLDQMINDRGILIDMGLVENAIAFDQRSKTELTEKLQGMTALDNPNSVAQMKNWLTEHGVEAETLGKKAVAELIKTAPAEIQDVLAMRLQLAKSSVSKYQAMQRTVCSDGRARGCSSSMEPIVPVDGRGEVYNYRIYLRTTFRTWRPPGTW